MPKAGVEITDANGNPRVNVPITYSSDPHVFFRLPDSTNWPIHHLSAVTDSNGVSQIYYTLGNQPNWFRRQFFGANRIPPQLIEISYTNSAGETVRSRVWVDVP